MNNKEVQNVEEAIEMLQSNNATIKSESLTFANRVSSRENTQHKDSKVKENK
jgi:FtsZ-binding cell division protein ZapB